MSKLRKPLSVLLSVLLIMSCLSAAMGVWAVSASELQSLMSNSAVSGASWNGTQNNTSATGTNALWQAAEAYYSYFVSNVASWNNRGGRDQNVANNTSTKVIATITNQIGYSTYVTYMGGNPSYCQPQGIEQGLGGITSSFTVNRDKLSTFMSYTSVEGIPTGNVNLTKKYTYVNSVASEGYSEGSGTNKSNHTKYWHYLTGYSAVESNPVSFAAIRSAMLDYRSYFTPALVGADLTTKTAADLISLSQTAQNKRTALVNALSAQGFPLSDAIVAQFGLMSNAQVNAYIAEVKFMADVIIYDGYNKYFLAPATGVVFVDLASLSYDQLVQLRSESTANFNQLNVIRTNTSYAEVRAELEANYGLNFDAIDAFRTDLQHRIEVFELVALKNQIDADIITYADYDSVDDAGNDIPTAINDTYLQTAIGRFAGYRSSIASHTPAYVAEIFTAGTAYVDNFYTALTYERNFRGLEIISDSWFPYYIPRFTEDLTAITSEDLMTTKIPAEESSRSNFRTNYATAQSSLSANDLNILYGTLYADVDAYVDSLYRELETRITNEVALVISYYDAFGGINAQNFTTVQSSIGRIETDIYNFLSGTGYMTAQTRNDYSRIYNTILQQYTNFVAQGAFANFQKIDLSSQYPTRFVRSDDLARSSELGKNYVVNEAALNQMISALDDFLLGTDFADILNLDENTLDEFLDNTIADLLYKDEIINMLVQMLYPMLVDMLNDLLAGIPSSYDTGVWPINSVDIVLHYDVRSLASALGLGIYPNQVAGYIDSYWSNGIYNDFSAVRNTLSNYSDWSQVPVNEDGDFMLVWGIDTETTAARKQERFLCALSEIFDPLIPVVRALLSGNSFEKGIDKVGHAEESSISIDADLDPLRINGANVYTNVLAPVLEALGCPGVVSAGTINSYGNNSRQFVDAIFNPVIGLVNKLKMAPLATLVDILPNLCHAVSYNLLQNCLNNINLSIYYRVTTSGWIEIKVLEDTQDVSLADSLDLSEEELGFNIKDVNAIIGKLIGGLFDDATIQFPIINAGLVGRLGTLTVASSVRQISYNGLGAGQRYTIVADRADVLYYLLTWLVDAAGDSTFISKLFRSIKEDPTYEINSTLTDIFTNLGADRGSSIAALMELFTPQRYEYTPISWTNTTTPVSGAGPASLIYLKYGNQWTREKAEYISENINDVVQTILNLSADEGETVKTLDGIISDAVDGIFTEKMVVDFAHTLAGLKTTFDLPENILELIQTEFNLSLDAWDAYAVEGYDWGFVAPETENSYQINRQAFADGISTLLAPLTNLLKFVLAGENIGLLDGRSGAKCIEFMGYNGYSYGVVPLLEALGCQNLMTQAEYNAAIEADPTRTIGAILDPIFARLDEVIDDPIHEILDLLPTFLYFVESGGLKSTVRNTLMSLFVLLDTARPIYNLDLTELVDKLTESDDPDDETGGILDEAGISLTDINLEGLVKLVENLVGLDLTPLFSQALRSVFVGNTEQFSSKSGFGTGYRIPYTEGVFEQCDVLTVVLSIALEVLQYEDNMTVLEELVGMPGLGEAIMYVMGDNITDMAKIDWLYFDPAAGLIDPDNNTNLTLPERSIVYLSYPNNWTYPTADELQSRLAEIVDAVIKQSKGLDDGETPVPGETYYNTLSELLDDKISSLYTDETVNKVAGFINRLLEDIDANLVEVVGVVLDLDMTVWNSYDENTVWNVTDRDSFIDAMCTLIAPIYPIIDWIFLSGDYKFFTGDEYSGDEGRDLVTVNGAEGYLYGLVPLLEALGVDNLPTRDALTAAIDADPDNRIKAVATPVLDWLDTILANPVDELIDLLPNLIYFINADGLTVSVNNMIRAITNITEAITPIADVDLDEKLGFPISDLSLNSIYNIVKDKTGIDLAASLDGFLDNFFIGELEYFDSANGQGALRMKYSTEEDRADMLTILLCLVVQVVDYDGNAEAFEELFGADIYQVINNVLDLHNLDIRDISWYFTEYADTGEVFSPIETSTLFTEGYGKYWTREKAEYVDANLDNCVSNLIHLLGVELEEEVRIEDLTDLLNTYVQGTVYTQNIANKLLNAILKLAVRVDELPAAEHIKAVVKEALGVDLDAWDMYTPDYDWGFEDGDRAAFTAAILDIISPLYPLLDWLFCDEDISILVDENGDDAITLPGAEGYAYGAIPILEALRCENILAPAEYYAAVESNQDNYILSIINPVLDKIDVILANPADEIMEILPGVIYFINSNGLDTCFRNLLNSVYTVLDAIEPVIDVDLYDLIGIDLAEINFDYIYYLICDKLEEELGGLELSKLLGDAIGELTTGTIVSFTSLNGLEAYTMDYASKADRADMVTIVLRLALEFVTYEENEDKIIQALDASDSIDDTAKAYIKTLLETLGDFINEDPAHHTDMMLGTMYYIFYGANVAAEETDDWLEDTNKDWQFVFNMLNTAESSDIREIGSALSDILNKYLEGVVDPEGLASDGLVPFLQKIIEFFKKIMAFFQSLFS